MSPSLPTLYLIDGYAQFFRAYHAVRTPMSSPVTKEPTNMTFGFVGMLLRLLRGQGNLGGPPAYVALTLDVSGDRGTFRSQLYPEYKANRGPPPEDLSPQVDRCLAIMETIGVPILGAEGFEADDVIATVVSQVRTSNPDVLIRIVSKDKDLKQLMVEGRVELFDVHTDQAITAALFQAECGLTPAQVIDMLALMGDNVDNVPGVEGIGPKTAAQLICQYGSLDNLLAHADEIKGKRGEALRATAPKLALSRELVTLRHDAPARLDLQAAETGRFKVAELLPILRELGFNRYQDEVRALLGETPAAGAASATTDPEVRILARARTEAVESVGGAGSGGRGRAAGTRTDAGVFTGGLFDQPQQETPESVAGPAGIRMPEAGEYRCITTEGELRAFIEQMRTAAIVGVDTETTGLPALRHELAGVCLSVRAGTGVYVPVRSPTPERHMDERTVLDILRPVLEDASIGKCGHNLKFDALVLRKAGVRLAGFSFRPEDDASDPCEPAGERDEVDAAGRAAPLPADGAARHFAALSLPVSTVFDTMIASYLIDPTRSSHRLDALALALLNRTNISITELIGTGSNQIRFDQVPIEQATQYAAEDADVALQLREIMLPQLTAMGLLPLFTRVEMPLVEVLAELEWNGIRVDKAELERQRARLQVRIDQLRKEIVAYAEEHLQRPFNPDSPRQLAEVLFNKRTDEPAGFGLKPLKRVKTGYSTDTEVLAKLADDDEIDNPIPGLIVEHRQLSKLVGTYLENLVEDIYPAEARNRELGLDGRIHCSFNQTVASTGRLSSSEPNLQNIPIRADIGREIRKAFVAGPGDVLVSADYSQIELRLLAHLSRDEKLIEAFQLGEDIHTAVAAQIHGVALDKVTKAQRSGAKMVNFGIVYGVTPFGLARRLKIETPAAAEIIDAYKKRFAGITTFLQECVEFARRFGYVETMLKRRRPILDIESLNPSRRSLAERLAINSVVQGSAADLIKLAMVELEACIEASKAGEGTRAATARGRGPSHRAPDSLRMLLQIHDELVFECRREHADAAVALVVDRMEHAMMLTVPLKVDARYAVDWFEGK